MIRMSLRKYLEDNPVTGPAVYLPDFGVWSLKNRRGETLQYVKHPPDNPEQLMNELAEVHHEITGWFQKLSDSEMAQCEPWTLRVQPRSSPLDYIFIDEKNPQRSQRDWIRSQESLRQW
jgi:hypothetical protein